jgi:hypothetical protein
MLEMIGFLPANLVLKIDQTTGKTREFGFHMNVNTTRIFKLYVPVGMMVVLAAFSRLIPHPPNFTAVTAMALMAGVAFTELSLALLVPFLSLLITDLILGFHPTILPVYFAFFAVTIFARKFLKGKSIATVTLTGALAGLWFWLVSNFAVWALMDFYSKDGKGLLACFVSAIPFLETQVLGDLFFTAVMFSFYSLLLRFSAKSYSNNVTAE